MASLPHPATFIGGFFSTLGKCKRHCCRLAWSTGAQALPYASLIARVAVASDEARKIRLNQSTAANGGRCCETPAAECQVLDNKVPDT